MNPEQLAQDYQLGAPIASFGWHRDWAKSMLVIFLFLLPIALLFSFLIIGIPLFIFCAFKVYESIRRLSRGKVVFLYEHGWIDLRKRHPAIIRYSEMQSLKTCIAKQYLHGIVYLWTTFIYTIELKNGKKLVFNHFIQGIEHLGTVLGEKLVEQKLPTAIATFQNQQPLHFGKLVLSSEGLRVGKQQLSWSELGALQVVPNAYVPVLSIYSTTMDRQGNLKRWKCLRIDVVTDLPLLLAVVESVRSAPMPPSDPSSLKGFEAMGMG